MVKHNVGALIICLSLTGCADMADTASRMANIGVVEQEKSTFDGASIIKMSPANLYREGAMMGVPFKLGARWNSKAPDQVALILSYQSDVSVGSSAYVGFSGLSVNIDGKISSYRVNAPTSLDNSGYNTVSRTIYTESANAVVIPLVELKRMLAARDCRLRIETNKGYQDAQFSIERIPGGQATAIIPLREFMGRIEATASKP